MAVSRSLASSSERQLWKNQTLNCQTSASPISDHAIKVKIAKNQGIDIGFRLDCVLHQSSANRITNI
jgi:hypothetical protein